MCKLSAEKSAARRELLQRRRSIDDALKKSADEAIFRKVAESGEFLAAKTLLCYVSLADEVDTAAIIDLALSMGKTVAVPKTDAKSRTMRFLKITSRAELRRGAYGIAEPFDSCGEMTDYADSLCIVPALGFDGHGSRLGYGGGYYDRFLSGYTGATMGLCYRLCFVDALPREKTDVSVDSVVTESGVYRRKI